MSKRFVVASRESSEPIEFTYPADPISLRAIRDAGGLSQMSDEQKTKLKFKTVVPGDDCSDMPEPALSIYVERGWVVEAPVDRRKPKEEVTE